MTQALEHRVATLEREMRDLESSQETRHAENSLRLAKIETILTEIAVYTKIGRRLMNIVYVVAGGVGSAVVLKWLGVVK